MSLTFGSLFAGIGGIDLGLERAGMECKWQVEIDDYARAILEKHWPEVPKYRDVRYFLGSKRWRQVRDTWRVDLIAGGFPCQDISNAGKRAGIEGKRSGLWSEFARIIRLLRPRFVLVENVDALAVRGLGRVLADLAALGFDAEWDRIPAAAVGAPHQRWRIFIVAYTNRQRREERGLSAFRKQDIPDLAGRGGCGSEVPDAIGDGICLSRCGEAESSSREVCGEARKQWLRPHALAAHGDDVSDSNGGRLKRGEVSRQRTCNESKPLRSCSATIPHAESRWAGQCWREQFKAYCEGTRNLFWPDAEPPVCGVADGVPYRVDRLRGLGNAVVPQIVEWIGTRILAIEGGV